VSIAASLAESRFIVSRFRGIGTPRIARGFGIGHTCALTNLGAAYCWGDYERGQLGIGSGGFGSEDLTPHPVPALVSGRFFRPSASRRASKGNETRALRLRCRQLDLTPAMLSRFQKTLEARSITGVQLRQADVLALETLPSSWTNYDLILSTSMLEYLPKQDLPRALKGLHAGLARDGHLLVMITKKIPETKVLIEWLWHAERYTGDELRRAFQAAGFEDLTFRARRGGRPGREPGPRDGLPRHRRESG
jgi:hypothetical protein